jgi:hypothetical protein
VGETSNFPGLQLSSEHLIHNIALRLQQNAAQLEQLVHRSHHNTKTEAQQFLCVIEDALGASLRRFISLALHTGDNFVIDALAFLAFKQGPFGIVYESGFYGGLYSACIDSSANKGTFVSLLTPSLDGEVNTQRCELERRRCKPHSRELQDALRRLVRDVGKVPGGNAAMLACIICQQIIILR